MEYVDEKTVRTHLRIGKSAFRKLVKQGLPRIRFNGRLIRYVIADVDAWAAGLNQQPEEVLKHVRLELPTPRHRRASGPTLPRAYAVKA